jgi:predicted dehydrogenase
VKKKGFSRREFLGTGAAAAGASLAGMAIGAKADDLFPRGEFLKTPDVTPPSDRVRFGIIGVGMQGNGLLDTSIKIPGVECAAACDVYDGRHVLAREIAGASLPVTRRYQELLANKDIDCIIAAVPDHWHKQMVLDSLSAGKDIYIEKPMSHEAAEGVAMADAQKKTGRIVQVGSQRVSSIICAKAKEMLASGIVGDITLVDAQLGRNDPCGAWQYPPPPDLSPANLDWDTWIGPGPKHAFDPVLFAGWRRWREYGTGVAGDLLVHLISGFLFMTGLNEAPKQALAVGAIRRWKDGRNMPDVHVTSFYYGDLPVTMRLNLGTEVPERYLFQGSKGVLEMSGSTLTFTPQPGIDTYPCYYTGSYPRAMREEYERQWHEQNDAKMASLAMQETLTYRAPDYDDTRAHLQTFFNAVRSRQPVVEDALFGHHAALACHMANESYFRKTAVSWDAASKMIRS